MENNQFSGQITSKGIKVLLFYFPVLLIISILFTTSIILINNGIIENTILYESSNIFANQIALAVIGSLSTNLMGCTIFYTRKIYKILLSSSFCVQNYGTLQTLGTILYFIIRPVFSMCFTLLLIIGLKAGLINIFQNNTTISSSFTDICMFISFFIGFSSGKFLESIEKKSQSIAESIFND